MPPKKIPDVKSAIEKGSRVKAAPKATTNQANGVAQKTKKVPTWPATKSKVLTNGGITREKQPLGEPVVKKTAAKNSKVPAIEVIAKSGTKRKETASEETVICAKPATKRPKTARAKASINTPPTERLDIYVFGEGSSGELGLGTAKNAIDVKRPRLNRLLLVENVGVVQIAVGGMHCAALTRDNKILTWGVNDQGALGRDTTQNGGTRDVDDSGSDADSDSGLNPYEATPTAIPSSAFPEGTIFTQVAAGDSITYAVTDEGRVWGWGTFRSNDGILSFAKGVRVQSTPALNPFLKNITSVVCGANHVLALNKTGNVFAWGSGQQNQLGRRVIERTKMNGLVPREFGLPRNKVRFVSAGAYHSFAITYDGRVYSWGLNNYGETGLPDGAGEEDAIILKPTEVPELSEKSILEVRGGDHHSIACTTDQRCFVWGRVDGCQLGLTAADLPSTNVIRDNSGEPRILTKPTPVPALCSIKIVSVAAGSDSSLVITADGKAYSWGFSANYQTGQGTDEDVEVATWVNNTAVRGKRLPWAGAGGQFSVLAGQADGHVNGV